MPDAPRSNSEKDSIGGWRPKGFIDLALEKGYKLSFAASSDDVSTHMSYANIYVTGVNGEAVLDGFKKRHLYAASDNILAGVWSGSHLLGDQFSTASMPSLQVNFTGTAPYAKVYIVKYGKYVYTREPKTAQVDFSWQDMSAGPGKVSYYYVRGEPNTSCRSNRASPVIRGNEIRLWLRTRGTVVGPGSGFRTNRTQSGTPGSISAFTGPRRPTSGP